ncbi:MAG: rhamnulokinase [Spirochaetia bacterium]|jgi:rhamnulokinase|nr:rhamnulokinase [Spirochaetia bacterium]
MEKLHVAVDLGGSHGRLFVGGAGHPLEKVYEFQTCYGVIGQNVYWEILGMFQNIKKGLGVAFAKYGDDIVSMGFDTWGVDYGLLDRTGQLIGLPYHFRDPRTLSVIDEVLEKAGGEETIYKATGIDKESFNTVYQLYETKKNRPEIFGTVAHYLSVPDLFGYWFTGVMESERTHASTTQLYDPFSGDWNRTLMKKLGFNEDIFSPIVSSGTVRGNLLPSVQKEIGCGKHVVFINSAEHDTASAVSTIAGETDGHTMFISSGTWSLVGCLLDVPLTTKAAYDKRFTNEVAASGRITFLRNIMGMLIQHECLHAWEEKEHAAISLQALDEATWRERDFVSAIDPLDDSFMLPNSLGGPMPERISRWCRIHGMSVPSNKGQFMVATYKGLAAAYCDSLKELESLTGKSFNTVHIIGGGSKNRILDQWTADRCNLKVIAGPAEASSVGNVIQQMKASGEIASVSEGLSLLGEDKGRITYTPYQEE